jgi:hypothetical protein
MDGIKKTKHDQWMILPRGFVQFLKHNGQRMRILAARMEEHFATDESFFMLVLNDHPRQEAFSNEPKTDTLGAYYREKFEWEKRIANDHKRYITKFGVGGHPVPLKSIEPLTTHIDLGNDVFLVRKVDITDPKNAELFDWMDEHRRKV